MCLYLIDFPPILVKEETGDVEPKWQKDHDESGPGEPSGSGANVIETQVVHTTVNVEPRNHDDNGGDR